MSAGDDPRAPLSRGMVLDNRFRIRELLGAGSFGQVYSADQILFGRPLRLVALKLFFSDAVTSENAEDVLSDALTLLSLQEEHPHPEVLRSLVQVFDMGLLDAGRRAFMSMRLVPGARTLLNAVRRHGTGGMPVVLAFRFLRQILVPLAWMHTLNPPLAHGDLKPDNVLLTNDTELVITDFGLAARLPLGTRGGAIAYQAPETLNGLSGGCSADMYALGILWYEMLTGRHPFAEAAHDVDDDQDQSLYVMAHRRARKWEMRPANTHDRSTQTDRIVPPDEVNFDLRQHPQVVQMLAKCLRWSEKERYANAQELLNDVDGYLRDGVAKGVLSQQIIGVSDEPRLSEATIVQSSSALHSNAVALQAQGRLSEALQIVSDLVMSTAGNVDDWSLKARLEVQLSRVDEARKSAAAASRLFPQAPEAWELAAEILEACGQRTMAATYRKQAQELRKTRRK